MKEHKILIEQRKDESEAQTYARFTLSPEARAALTVHSVAGGTLHGLPLDLNALAGELNQLTEQVKGKDLSRSEAMLAAQAHTLDQLFNKLTLLALNNLDNLTGAETCLKLAMKAQSQCRNTWEAVSAIQNPPLANYAKQLNIGHNQQINNSRAEDTNAPNQQGAKENELLQDKRNSGVTVPINPPMETLAEVDRAKDTGGET